MKKNFLIACDLEGVNGVVGEAYTGLYKGCEEWKKAIRQAALEINAAAEALFEMGAESVCVWDNHGGGGNINADELDARIKLLKVDASLPRMYFGGEYDAVLYFGYHAMEGTLGGVLAHTMNSAQNQYYKLNGKYIGEIDMDAYIASSHGVPSCLFVGGDIACAQAQRAVPGIVTVVTKTERGRNAADFRDNTELFADIRSGVKVCVSAEITARPLTYPAVVEKSFKRTEDAAKHLESVRACGLNADYPECEILGRDAHTVVMTANNIDEFIKCI